MPAGGLQVGPDGKFQIAPDGSFIVSGTGEQCCCDETGTTIPPHCGDKATCNDFCTGGALYQQSECCDCPCGGRKALPSCYVNTLSGIMLASGNIVVDPSTGHYIRFLTTGPFKFKLGPGRCVEKTGGTPSPAGIDVDYIEVPNPSTCPEGSPGCDSIVTATIFTPDAHVLPCFCHCHDAGGTKRDGWFSTAVFLDGMPIPQSPLTVGVIIAYTRNDFSDDPSDGTDADYPLTGSTVDLCNGGDGGMSKPTGAAECIFASSPGNWKAEPYCGTFGCADFPSDCTFSTDPPLHCGQITYYFELNEGTEEDPDWVAHTGVIPGGNCSWNTGAIDVSIEIRTRDTDDGGNPCCPPCDCNKCDDCGDRLLGECVTCWEILVNGIATYLGAGSCPPVISGLSGDGYRNLQFSFTDGICG